MLFGLKECVSDREVVTRANLLHHSLHYENKSELTDVVKQYETANHTAGDDLRPYPQVFELVLLVCVRHGACTLRRLSRQHTFDVSVIRKSLQKQTSSKLIETGDTTYMRI